MTEAPQFEKPDAISECHPERSEAQPNEVEGPSATQDPDQPDVIAEDPPHWIQQASLSELLLWRLGIPLDREKLESEYAKQQEAINLKPPITTHKVADAIAHLSMQVMRGELDPTTAKTSLYALQTLLTALRLQIVEDKKPSDVKKKTAQTRAPKNRRKQSASHKRSK